MLGRANSPHFGDICVSTSLHLQRNAKLPAAALNRGGAPYRRDRFNAFSSLRRQKPHAIMLKRLCPIWVPNHARQRLDIRCKPQFTLILRLGDPLSASSMLNVNPSQYLIRIEFTCDVLTK